MQSMIFLSTPSTNNVIQLEGSRFGSRDKPTSLPTLDLADGKKNLSLDTTKREKPVDVGQINSDSYREIYREETGTISSY